jgi:hypothetical protein
MPGALASARHDQWRRRTDPLACRWCVTAAVADQ